MRAFLLVLVAVALFGAVQLPRNETDDGWILLHDGDSNMGWTVEPGSGWSSGNGLLSMDGNGGPGYIRSNSAFVDFVMRLELRAAAANSKVSLIVRAAREGNPKDTGYEIVLGPGASDPPSGSIAGQAKAGGGAPAPGQWTAYEIECTGGSLIVRSGGRVLSSAGGLAGQAGLIMLQSNKGGRMDFRSIRLKPLTPLNLFNGADLSGWKSTGTQPKQGGKITKLFGGGKGKPKEVKWTVTGGAIHGEEGPGQLETATAYGDFVFQAAVRVNAKKDSTKKRYALLFRGDAAGLGSGYEVTIQPGATGGIAGLASAARGVGSVNQYSVVTLAATERRIQIWVDGLPVVDTNDVRTEGTNPKKEARITPGTIAFYSPEEDANIDIRAAKVFQTPKVFGHNKKSAPVTSASASLPPPPAAAAGANPPAAGGGANNAASDQLKALQDQMRQQKADKDKEDAEKQKVGSLMSQALSSNSPQQQVQLYDQILMLDPNNLVAANERKTAQGKIDAAKTKEEQDREAQQKQATEQAQKQQTFDGAMQGAEAAFLAGNLTGAEQSLSVAEKIAPDNPQVRALRTKLDGARSRWTSILAVAGIGGGVILLGGLGVMWRSRRKKDPYLEIIQGLDKGKKFNIDQEVVGLGAIAEDGGARNDVVLRDAERMVSRFHAQILNKEGKLYVVDLGSSNGTTVDKKRISAQKPHPLTNGSRVNFGGTCAIRIGYEKRQAKKS